MGMAVGFRLWCCLFFAFAIICSARNTISFSGNEMMEMVEERFLGARTDDYNEPSANPGHEPKKGSGGRKTQDTTP